MSQLWPCSMIDLHTKFSRVLHKTEVRLTSQPSLGSVLLCFLNVRVIPASFHAVGRVPDETDFWKINGFTNTSAMLLIKIGCTLPDPIDLLASSSLNSFKTSVLDNISQYSQGYSLLPCLSLQLWLLGFLLVKTVVKTYFTVMPFPYLTW